MFYNKYFYSARVTISADRWWRLRAPDSFVARPDSCTHAHRAEGVAESEGRQGANGGRIGVGGGNGDGNWGGGGNGDLNGDGDGDEAETRTGVEVNEGTQDGNGDGSGYGD